LKVSKTALASYAVLKGAAPRLTMDIETSSSENLQ
jgi:hypothetical protein